MATPTPATPPPATPTRAPAESVRDRIGLYGAPAASDAELLAAVLGGTAAAMTKATAVLASGGLYGIASGNYTSSTPAVRHTIDAVIELSRRLALQDVPYSTSLRGPEDVARYARAAWGGAAVESFYVIGLDARGRVRLVREVSRGSVAHVDCHPREVFRPLVMAGLHSCIAVHNHPSGEPDPSQADIELTRRLADVGRLLGIPVLDHVIVTRTRSVSLASLGMIADTTRTT